MKEQGKETWRSVVRKLKQARGKKERLTNRLNATPERHTKVRDEINEQITDIKIIISVLELKSDRLKPKKV